MFDVFYISSKAPGLFPHERSAESIDHAINLSRTRYLWIVDSCNDYSDFDWLWEPVPWESTQAHVWPSQHQVNGGTWLISKAGYQDVNRSHTPILRTQSVPRLHIRHRANSTDQGNVNARYISDYLGTLRRVLSKTDWTYCWVTADVCDYQDFDFTWHPSEWQHDMLHIFASNEQKFGDTFYVHVPTFLEKTTDLKVLEWFETLHFVEDISVPRNPVPAVRYDSDSLVPAIWDHEFQDPVTQFYKFRQLSDTPTISLWQERTKTVIPLSDSGATVLVPRECKNYLKYQIYDYPWINKSHVTLKDPPLDIVFISNGEHGADHHFEYLQWAVQQHYYKQENRIHRVQGVSGRVTAYQAAAELSTTDWFLAVFAKLQVNEDFDWTWQPDRLQEAKHYIFHAYNPVNDLTYGHQAMIAYNRRLVLENTGHGLDFTLDQPHEVVSIVSGTAYYDNDPWTCWRTAFREALKLRHSLPDVENEYRLGEWLTKGNGVNGHWSVLGASDAMNYYESVGGDFAELKKSYEWQWLASYAMILHPMLFAQSKT
jgi:hypothetical protein